METKNKNLNGVKTKNETPKKLSKAGMWFRSNAKPLIKVLDRRAANK